LVLRLAKLLHRAAEPAAATLPTGEAAVEVSFESSEPQPPTSRVRAATIAGAMVRAAERVMLGFLTETDR
jgi:hypothetical protein